MKWKIAFYINPLLISLTLFSLLSCGDKEKSELDNIEIKTVPVARQLSAVETKIHSVIIDIEKKEIELSGDSVLDIDIEGMEIIKYSRKEYLVDELRSQQEIFKKYLDYLDHTAKNNKAINNPIQRQESQAKHNAVVAYLQKTISKTSAKQEIYKVIYYLRARTKKMNYTQPKTTYLDEGMKKIIADYSFLNAR
ncbi:MAG: hypothetical protein ABI685_01360 [Ferruginibacter sp.]